MFFFLGGGGDLDPNLPIAKSTHMASGKALEAKAQNQDNWLLELQHRNLYLCVYVYIHILCICMCINILMCT